MHRFPLNSRFSACLTVALLAILAGAARGQLLEGEFGDIDLGRPLIERSRFPTLAELRQSVRDPKIGTVLMLKLYGDQNDHYLPVWSHDGRRLAFQRSDIRANASQVLLYGSKAQATPKLLSDQPDAYDYMFRWGTSSPQGFVFSRIRGANSGVHLVFSPDGQATEARTEGPARHVYPALYERTDGIWRLAYERDGEVCVEAFSSQRQVEAPQTLLRGAAPRWSRDGRRLLLLRERRKAGRAPDFEVVLRDLRSAADVVLASPAGGTLRGPVWSPDERWAAWHARAAGEDQAWRISLAAIEGRDEKAVAQDVVVNLDFDAEGPSFEPSGRRIWFFSQAHHREAYYPLAAADLESGETLLVDYPSRCTNPQDLAVNPATATPEIAFVGHEGQARDLFVVFLNHY